MTSRDDHRLFNARLTRREVLVRGGAMAIAAPSLGSILAACMGSSSQAPTGTVTVVQVAEPASLAPDVDQISADQRIWNHLFDGLTWYQWDGKEFKLSPRAAASWKQVDERTWRFTIRQGVKFHNGETMDAQAVAFSLQTFINNQEMASSDFTGYTAHVVDANTVDIFTPQPNLNFAPALMSELYIYPPKYYAQVGKSGFNSAPIGTGPYIFDSWQKGVSISMHANPNYWGEKATINKLVFKWVGEASSRIALLQTGEADMVTDLPPDLGNQVSSMQDRKLYVTPGTRRVFLEFNCKSGVTADVRVRQAVNYAIDRKAIVNGLFGGKAAVLNGVFIPGEVGYDESFTGYTYDPDKAKSLLAEAGFSSGVTIPFQYPLGFYINDKETSEVIQSQLAKAGIKCQMNGKARSALVQQFGTNQAPGMTYWTAGPLYYDPNGIMTTHFDSRGLYHYNDSPEQDKLLDDALVTADPTARNKKYQDLNKYLIMDKAEWAPLIVFSYVVGANKKLQWTPRPDGMLNLDQASLR
jgi:peptide/nickel transport system substrate-binding protein